MIAEDVYRKDLFSDPAGHKNPESDIRDIIRIKDRKNMTENWDEERKRTWNDLADLYDHPWMSVIFLLRLKNEVESRE